MNDRRLLILDDDPLVGQTIGYIASSVGMETRITTTPEEFFQLVQEWVPHRIALDLVMPDMDGVEVLVELARRECQAHIIITSGVGPRVLDAARRSAVEHGLNILGVLSKPFSPSVLRQLLTVPPPGTAPHALRSSPGIDGGIDPEELVSALERRELVLAYQPKLRCRTGTLAGFEALVRWRRPDRGLVMPGAFVPVAERHGLITDLTDQVLEHALEWYATRLLPALNRISGRLSENGPPTLSINLSARTLQDNRFVEQLDSRCTTMGIAPEHLIFELTETSAMEDPVGSLDLLTRLRMKGFQLSIDDFGTGYSSMLQLVRLPFSEIKVDKSFVMTATSSSESRAVVRSVVDLGHSLGLLATAEGVEDAATLAYLESIGCDQAQGYFIARPLDGNAALEWLRQRG